MSMIKERILKQRTQRELAELLSYACLYNEKTVFHKDGAFSATFFYVAQDADSATGHMLDANAYVVMSALNLLSDGWMVETNLMSQAVKDYPDNNHFTSVTAAIIDDARRFHFGQTEGFYQSLCYLTLSYVPTGKAGKKLVQSLMDDEKRERNIDEEYDHFEKVVRQFMTLFEQITVIAADEDVEEDRRSSNVIRLKGDHLLSFLSQTITGDDRALKFPKTSFFLDCMLSSHDFAPGIVPMLGKKYIKVLAIDDLPEQSSPAILDILNFVGCDYRWSSRWIALSQETASAYIKKIATKWSNKAIGGLWGTLKQSMGFAPKIDLDAQKKYIQTQGADEENKSGDIRYGFMTSTVILMDEDFERLKSKADIIKSAIESQFFKVREETVNATDAWLGSIPAHGCYNVRKPLCDSLYAAHALPTSSIWAGDSHPDAKLYPNDAPALMKVRTKGSRIMNFNFHVADVGHFLIIGPTGGGKSTLIQTQMAQFLRYKDARIIAFDKDKSHYAMVKMLNGQYFNAMGGDKFSPFEYLVSLNEDSAEFELELSSLTSWIEHICELQNVTITANRSKEIKNSIYNLYKSSPDMPLNLLSFHEQEVREAFFNFLEGSAQNILMGQGRDLSAQDIVAFDLTALLKMPDKEFVPIIEAFFARITRVFKDQRPTLLIIEEASKILSHPVFKTMVDDWLTTLRKFNVAVGLVFQDPEQMMDTGIGGTLKSQCFTRMYLPNNALKSDETQQQKYALFGLNEQQISIIGHAIAKQDYYLTSPKGNRLFQLDLDELALSFIGTSSESDYQVLDELIQNHPDEWVAHWLEKKGLCEWKDYVLKHYIN